MGAGRWTDKDWEAYRSARIDGKRIGDIFGSRNLDPSLDPKKIKVRESCDSPDNPHSTAVIVALDVTGSMGPILEATARRGLSVLATEIYARRPVSDPHLMCMGVGDAEAGDRAPLQVTQFEADIRIADQLAKIWLEGGGGGNSHESYLLPLYFAAMRTRIDCAIKRGRKGYLFTIGDEEPHMVLRADDVERVLGERPSGDLSAEQVLAMASRQYEVYHVMVEEGNHFRSFGDRVAKAWRGLLGQRALRLSDHTRLAEVIVSAIQVNEGATATSVAASWDGAAGPVVERAISGLSRISKSETHGLVRL